MASTISAEVRHFQNPACSSRSVPGSGSQSGTSGGYPTFHKPSTDLRQKAAFGRFEPWVSEVVRSPNAFLASMPFELGGGARRCGRLVCGDARRLLHHETRQQPDAASASKRLCSAWSWWHPAQDYANCVRSHVCLRLPKIA